MRRPTYYFFLTVLLLFANKEIQARHLVGGSLLYNYLGEQANGTYGYRINVEMYRDCSSNIQPPVQFDDSIFIGLYDRGTNKLVTVLTEYFGGEKEVQPPNGGTFCTFQTSTCLDKTVYSGTVYLPASSSGYYAEYQRCCRNQVVVNLVYGTNPQGETFLGIIPPTSIVCSSPYFNSVPSPYVCVDGTDTASLSNFALDTDGDSLVYKLAWPYGGLNMMNPQYMSASQLPATYSSPSLVTYSSGYSFTQPFGTGGYAHIDSLTGVTNLFIPNVGYYVIAYDVYAYRNGQFLTKVRRDLEIIAIRCPGKPAAKRLPISGLKQSGLQSTFYLQAGDTVGFDIGYTCSDSIELTYTGDVFNSSDGGQAPYATLDSFTTLSQTTIYDHFFWQTACAQARVGPYVFLVDVTDNGCPPKSTYQGYSIYVFNLKVGGKIIGEDTACYDPLGQNYSVQYAVDSSHFIWEATHGTIIGNAQNDSVNIVWDTAYTTGTIQVATKNNHGCPGDTLVKTVNIHPPVHPPAIKGPQYICAGLLGSYYIAKLPKGDTIIWAVKGDSLLSGITDTSINVVWRKKTDTGEVYLIEYNTFGCISDTEKYQVIVSAPKLDSIIGPPSVCPHSKSIQYSVKGQARSTYFWSVVGGTIISGGNTNTINVDWGGIGTGEVKVLEITGAGCIGDTSYEQIAIEYKLQTPPIQGDTLICENPGNYLYSTIYSAGSTYDWTVTGGTITFNPGNATIDVQWGGIGSGEVSVIQTAYDSVIGRQCIGQQISLNVNIYPVPNTTPISGPDAICTNKFATYSVSGLPGSQYIWMINGDTQANNTGSGTRTFYFSTPGIYTLSVVEMSAHNCPGALQSISIVVSAAPAADTITGPVKICVPNVNNITYSVKNKAGSTYLWQVQGGVIVSGQGQNQVTVNWVGVDSQSLTVTETNSIGCTGDPRTLVVFIDSLSISVKVVTTELENENLVSLTWYEKNNDHVHKGFEIYREKAGDNVWDLLDTVPDTVFTYIDQTAQTQSTSYYYKVTTRNLCGDIVAATPHRTILLQGKYYDDSDNFIYWNKYEGWPEGVYSYRLYYGLNQDTALEYMGYTTDTSLIKISPETGYQVCYRVQALDNADTTITSLSNKICFDMEPIVYIPNAFSPNGDGINDYFRVTAINYNSFHLEIFNRWGEELFTSNDPKNEWDGTFKGKKCPSGEYLYIVTVDGVGRNIYKSGTVLILR